jgi:hypothetical protein
MGVARPRRGFGVLPLVAALIVTIVALELSGFPIARLEPANHA